MHVYSLWQTDHTQQDVFEQHLGLRPMAEKGDKTRLVPALNISYLWENRLDTFLPSAHFYTKAANSECFPHTNTHTKTQWIRVYNICLSQNGCVPKAMWGGDGDGCGGRLTICVYKRDVIAENNSLSLSLSLSLSAKHVTVSEQEGRSEAKLWLLIFLAGLS